MEIPYICTNTHAMSNRIRLSPNRSAWWGPPRKFDPNIAERRISWLELFYDLVYVIAISKITHHLGAHISLSGFLEEWLVAPLDSTIG